MPQSALTVLYILIGLIVFLFIGTLLESIKEDIERTKHRDDYIPSDRDLMTKYERLDESIFKGGKW